MSDLSALEDDSFLEAFHERLTPLMRRKSLPSALEFVTDRLHEALACGSAFRVSHLYSIQGSIFTALDRCEEALAAYRNAAQVSPTEPHHTLALASHLIFYFHNQPAEALQELDKATAAALADPQAPYSHGYARGLRGVALLESGNTADAIATWNQIVTTAKAPGAMPGDLDLLLAEALVDHRLHLHEVGEYLNFVAQKASTTPSYDLSERCARVESKLQIAMGENRGG